MQKRVILLLVVGLVFGFNLLSKEVKLGEEIKIEKATNVSEILEKPAEFLNKAVRVEGYIIDGCKHHGTWIAIAGDKDFQKITVRDKEGKLKFPLDHKGKYSIVEGSVYSVHLTEEQALRWLKHLEEVHQQKTDMSKAKGGMTLYRISPTGAIVKDAK
jgi:hypothetical protein